LESNDNEGIESYNHGEACTYTYMRVHLTHTKIHATFSFWHMVKWSFSSTCFNCRSHN